MSSLVEIISWFLNEINAVQILFIKQYISLLFMKKKIIYFILPLGPVLSKSF